MKTSYLTKIVVIFAALVAAGSILIAAGSSANQEIVRGTLPLIGVGLFTSGLSFFLIEMVRIEPRGQVDFSQLANQYPSWGVLEAWLPASPTRL